jgi:hypothetical protein
MFSGVGLFVFSDPGAAKAVLAFAYKIKTNLKQLIIISDRDYTFYSNFGLDVIITKEKPENIILTYKPDFIFTGTSYTSKIELEFLKVSKIHSINSYSFVDHWTSIKERFFLNNEFIFPHKILLIDKEAQKIALESGIDESLLTIFGNPYYDFLKMWTPIISKKQLFEQLAIPFNDKKTVVYAPDPLSNINGKEIYGFDELEVTSYISNILRDEDLSLNFILKLHPNQDFQKIFSCTNSNIVIADKDIDINSLIFYSDIVIGFFSNFLIESNIFGKKIYRILDQKKNIDPLNGKNIGEVIHLKQIHFLLKINQL